MFGLFSLVRAFQRNSSGASTADWVGSTAVFFICTAAAVYAIFGGKQTGLAKLIYGEETAGLVTVVNNQSERVSKDSSNINDMLSEVETWSPGGS